MSRHRGSRPTRDVVIVGASLAGFRTAQALRAHAFAGRIHLVGAETHLPYDRPSLSKGYLARTDPEADIWLATLQELDTLDLSLSLGRMAMSLDVEARKVELDDGSALSYDQLVVATGASPRLVAGLTESSRPSTVHTLRTIEDARVLSDLLAGGEPGTRPRLVVVGAGFIGSEVASTGLGLGAEVTMIDARPTPMHAVLHDEVGSLLASRQRDANAQLLMGRTVQEIMVTPDEDGGHVTDVRLLDGGSIRADLIVVGVGVTPNTTWLESSGLRIDDGLVCDETLRAAPGVWAVGDVCRWGRRGDPSHRLEHWTNTNAQADHVAQAIVGGARAPVFRNVPYYWSDQFGLRIEVIGEPPPDSDLDVVWGSTGEGSFVGVYRRRGQVAGAVAVNAVRPFLELRRAVAAATDWTEAVARVSW